MKHPQTLAVLGLVGTLASGAAAFAHASAKTASLHSPAATHAPVPVRHDALTRVATRLQARVERRFGQSPSINDLRDALGVRRALFARSIVVAFQDEASGAEVSRWTVSLGRYPDWMSFSLAGGPRFGIDESAIRSYMSQNAPDGLAAPSFATVVETHDEGKIIRATVEGEPKDGQSFDPDAIADAVIDAFDGGHDVAVVPVQQVQGAVLYDDGVTTRVLHELGVGRSVFDTSPWGRKQNVRKAMNEKANGVVIPQGSVFSYNSTLGGPVSHSNGWYDSLIIVNGKDLEPAPGGGICQSATTVYRAAMAAGLPIVTRKSHSLYVTYYKQYGMGMDATVFPAKQDMTFENDTDGPIVLLGKTDDHDNAYSAIYGIDDGRTVTLEGPYFGYTHTEPVMGRVLRSSEVAWIQRVTKPDGTTREQLQVAQYSGLPRSVALEFEPMMHGAADLVADAE
jgi:vancomycin resistance protein YoaR